MKFFLSIILLVGYGYIHAGDNTEGVLPSISKPVGKYNPHTFSITVLKNGNVKIDDVEFTSKQFPIIAKLIISARPTARIALELESGVPVTKDKHPILQACIDAGCKDWFVIGTTF